jgi:hypothetical protein
MSSVRLSWHPEIYEKDNGQLANLCQTFLENFHLNFHTFCPQLVGARRFVNLPSKQIIKINNLALQIKYNSPEGSPILSTNLITHAVKYILKLTNGQVVKVARMLSGNLIKWRVAEMT